jgi:hypothetical protein
MVEEPALLHRWASSEELCWKRVRRHLPQGILRCNPPHRSMTPPGSADRMALHRLRKAKGETGSPACRVCGKIYRLDVASFQRLQAGLCASCWRATPEGKEERRAADRHRYQTNEDRKAATAAAVARHRERQRSEGKDP